MPPFRLTFEPRGDLLYMITSTWGGNYGSLAKDRGQWVCNFSALDMDADTCRKVADKLDELNKGAKNQ